VIYPKYIDRSSKQRREMTDPTVINQVQFKFNRPKAIEAILYLSQKVSNPEIYDICKLLYLVDKTSLERYGRFVFGETYCAMKEGATPSNVYDILKEAKQEVVDGISVEGNCVIALRSAKQEVLSKSDLECLDHIIAIYGNVSYVKRRQDAHDEAWKKAWGNRGKSGSAMMPVETIAKLFADSDDLISYLHNSDG
jgi:uncharacterized phage-associated protein